VTKANLKTDVQSFWNAGSCGETYAQGQTEAEQYATQAAERYKLEPYIHPFARFEEGTGKDVLELGVGMGADHQEWAQAQPKSLTGVDLTDRAIAHTQKRLDLAGLTSTLQQSSSNPLPFSDETFDIVYSWGVIHHSPDTPELAAEICRVLRTGGVARIMIYHTWSLTGLMLWARYGLLRGRPLTPMQEIYATYLESPGTKAYTKQEARKMFLAAGFSDVKIHIQLGHGDLLEGDVGQRHRGRLLTVAKALWPAWFFKVFTPFLGLYLMIEAKK